MNKQCVDRSRPTHLLKYAFILAIFLQTTFGIPFAV